MRLKSYFLFMSRIDFPTKLLLFAHANSSCITFQCGTYLLSISFWIKELLLKTTLLHFLLRNNVLFFLFEISLIAMIIIYFDVVISTSNSWSTMTREIFIDQDREKNYLYRSVVYYLSLTRKILLSFWALSAWDDRVIGAMDCHLTTCAFNFIIIIDKVDFFVLLITSRRVTFSLLISALRILNHTYHKC